MNGINSTYLSQRWDDGILSFVFCVRDGYPNGRRHFSGSVFGGNLLPQKYSPTRRDDFVRCDLPGARPDFFEKILDYEDCGNESCTPQYAGNISRMAHTLAHGNTNYSENRDVVYAYDLMNRLTNVNDASTDLFDETFAYDPQGRIMSQRRGTNVTATSGGEYAYYANKNQLASVSAGMSAAVDSARIMSTDSNFVYDADGNMTYDASKKMTVSYDYRGLPTAFAKKELSGDSVRLLMTYDASGNRITKRYERKTPAETAWTLQLATHYTGLGSEIRENGLDNTAKVVVNLPQGLGRYGVENAVTASATTPGFEWYLKNHLGSTMLVYGTGSGSGSVKAAYDYRSFGEQVSMVEPADKVTENFTGKELDDETGLFHFGARTYDPMIAIWNGVDPKRQHNSSYVYGSNNPVNRVDPDGSADYNVRAENVGLAAAYDMINEAGTKANEFLWNATETALKVDAVALGVVGAVIAGPMVMRAATEVVAKYGPAVIETINNPANHGKAFLLGTAGKVISNRASPEVETKYDEFTDFVSNALPSEVTTFFSAGSATANMTLDAVCSDRE